MELNNKKKHLSRIKVSFIMLLFVMCFTMNVLFCGIYNSYEIFDKTTVNEMRARTESIIANEGHDHATYFKASFLNKNNSYNETITKNINSIIMDAAIPQGGSLLLYLIIVFLCFFLTLFILMPDKWTLINQKVRLDN